MGVRVFGCMQHLHTISFFDYRLWVWPRSLKVHHHVPRLDGVEKHEKKEKYTNIHVMRDRWRALPRGFATWLEKI